MKLISLALVIIATLSACTSDTDPLPAATAEPATSEAITADIEQPYSGLQNREIKALDAERVDDILAGRGAGYALAAELNSYPGPTHVIQMAEQLNLTGEQSTAIQAIFESMNAEAKTLGAKLIAAETDLDQSFSKGTISLGELDQLTATSSEIEGKLRAAHLGAHLDLKNILTQQQIEKYDQLRGYAGDSDESMDHSKMQHNG